MNPKRAELIRLAQLLWPGCEVNVGLTSCPSGEPPHNVSILRESTPPFGPGRKVCAFGLFMPHENATEASVAALRVLAGEGPAWTAELPTRPGPYLVKRKVGTVEAVMVYDDLGELRVAWPGTSVVTGLDSPVIAMWLPLTWPA